MIGEIAVPVERRSTSSDRKAVLYLGSGLFAYYLLTAGGHHYSSDGILLFQSSKALVYRWSLELEPPVLWGRLTYRTSPYGIGMSLAYVPLLILWAPLFLARPGLQEIPYDPQVRHNPELYANLPYLLCSVLNPVLTAATSCLVYSIGRAIGLELRWALVAGLAFGLASPATVYARMDWPQPLVGLCLTAAVAALVGAESRSRSYGRAGIWLGFGTLVRYDWLLFSSVVALWVGLRERSSGLRTAAVRCALLVAPVLLAVLATAVINQVKFGGVVPKLSGGVLFNRSLLEQLRGILGLLASPTKGVLFFFPLSWLVLPGLFSMFRAERRATRETAGLFALLLGAGLVFYGSIRFWGGQWSWGPRYLVPFVPLATVAATAWVVLGSGRGRQRMFFFLALLGLIVSLNGLLFDYNDFQRWVVDAGVNPDGDPFRLGASVLGTGWCRPPGRTIDLFLVRLASAEQVRRFSPLLGVGSGTLLPDPVLLAKTFAVLTAVVLVAWMAWSAGRLLDLVREDRVAGASDGS
jgi:hypothetical protein